MEFQQLVTIEGVLLFRSSEDQDLMKICNGHKNTPDQQVWYGCPEEGGSLHILGAWYPTKAGADHIHILDTATNRAERAVAKSEDKLLQSQTSWYQGGQDRCWMGMGLF